MIAPEQTYWDIVKTQFRKDRTAVAGLYTVVGLFVLAIFAPILATSSPFAMWRNGDALLERFDSLDADRDGQLSQEEFKSFADLFPLIDREGRAGRDEEGNAIQLPDEIITRAEVEAWGGWSFPWFRDLFDQNRFPSGVDIFFNLGIILVPFWFVFWIRLPNARKRVAKWGLLVYVWVFFSIVGPAAIVKSGVGKVLFFPQHALRYSKPKQDYLEQRPVLGRLLAEHKIEIFEERLASSRAQFDAAQKELTRLDLTDRERADAEAMRDAADDQVRASEREIKNGRDALAAVEALEKEPIYEATFIMPPVGYHHDDNDEERLEEAPTLTGWGIGHFLGTDTNGRDVLARIFYGARVSLTIGVLAVSIYCTIGTILGAIAGFFGGWVDMVISRVVEIMMCFPTFAFVLILVAVTGSKNIFMIMVAIGLVRWTGVTRLIRGQCITERSQDYVFAARALGIPDRRIAFKHVLPNAIHPMFVAATFGVAAAILLESGLAFLGLGDPLVPSWGQLLLQGRQTGRLWLILSPGIAIFITVTVLNLVGEGLRDALDPKLRQ